MNSNVNTNAGKIANILTDEPAEQVYMEKRLNRMVDDKRSEIIARAESIQRKMTSLIRDLQEGSSINSLGEIQGSGNDLDRLIGEYCMMQKMINEIGGSIQK